MQEPERDGADQDHARRTAPRLRTSSGCRKPRNASSSQRGPNVVPNRAISSIEVRSESSLLHGRIGVWRVAGRLARHEPTTKATANAVATHGQRHRPGLESPDRRPAPATSRPGGRSARLQNQCRARRTGSGRSPANCEGQQLVSPGLLRDTDALLRIARGPFTTAHACAAMHGTSEPDRTGTASRTSPRTGTPQGLGG